MSTNPPELDPYYSPQALASRMFTLDLAQMNIRTAVLSLLDRMYDLEARVKELEEEKNAAQRLEAGAEESVVGASYGTGLYPDRS